MIDLDREAWRDAYKATPEGTLHYAYDATGTMTNTWSDTPSGVNSAYQYDSLKQQNLTSQPKHA